MMGMSMSCSMRPEMRIEARLTMAQRILVHAHLHALVIELAGVLRDERYEPQASCPRCFRKLTPLEILKGFREVVTDFTTGCPECQHRFEPLLISFGNASNVELRYYCPMQVLERLRSLSAHQPDYIARELPGEYRSAVIHHGTLKNAFQQIGVEYPYSDVEGWESKAQPFFGRVPDTAIAKCTGVSVFVVRSTRKKAGVPAFNKRAALQEAEASS